MITNPCGWPVIQHLHVTESALRQEFQGRQSDCLMRIRNALIGRFCRHVHSSCGG